jgi:hypothetical protein
MNILSAILKSRRGLLIGLTMVLGAFSASASVITNISIVNITPASFSVVWASSPGVTPAISVYSDSGGTVSLAGQVGVKWYPLHTGDPTLTNSYYRRQNQSLIQHATINQGIVQVRVSGLAPNTTYYYRLQVTDTNGQNTIWPVSGALPSVTTAVENDFVVESRQLILTVPGTDPAGSIVILSNTNTSSELAAVVGDGVASNEVYFSLSDLLDASGQTNFLPLGSQSFTAQVLGASSGGASQIYSLNFTGSFLIGGVDQVVFSQQLTLSLSSTVLQEGQSGSLAISLNSSAGVSNLSFVLNLPTNRFSSLTLQGVSPQLGSSSLQPVGNNSLQMSFASAPGQLLQGSQQLAQLNFTTASNQSSAFVYFSPQSLQAVNADGSTANNSLVQGGRVVIIGPQPLLESLIASTGARQLALYGIPGDSYQIQSSPKPSVSNDWSNFERVPLTNQVEMLTGLDESKSVIFYRAYEFTALQPIMDVEPSVNGDATFVLYGSPWSAYEFEYATNLASPHWVVLSRFPFTNSFQIVTGLSVNTPDVFYRSLLFNADPPVLAPQLVNQNRSLMIYGLSGTNYGLQYSTNVSGTVTWYPLLSYRLTNAFQTITNLGNINPPVFYRLKKQ